MYQHTKPILDHRSSVYSHTMYYGSIDISYINNILHGKLYSPSYTMYNPSSRKP
jgi:hypothetical protein